jgi:hypothetical protein
MEGRYFMKYLIFIFSFCLLLPLFAERGGLNVRDFGAKGDGITDDTAAIQKALSATRGRPRGCAGYCPLGIPDQKAIIGVGEQTEVPEIFFPAGTYKISKPLVCQGTYVLRGAKGAVIQGTSSAQDLVYVHWAYRLRVEGLEFRGGKNQLLICTCNNESSRIIIRNCKFVNSSAAGVDCNCFRNPKGRSYKDFVLPPYNVTWENGVPQLTPNDLKGKTSYNNSTLFLCEKSSFENCSVAVNAGADGVTIRDCSVTAKATPAFIIGLPYNGHARLIGIKGRAVTGGDWIENYSTNLLVKDSKFTGAERVLVRQMRQKSSAVPDGLIISNCDVKCGKTKDGALIVFENSPKDNTPNLLEVSNVRERSGKIARAALWRIQPDKKRLLKGRHIDPARLNAYKASIVKWPYRIIFSGNLAIDQKLPGALACSRQKQVPSKLAEKLIVPPVKIKRPIPVKRLHAMDFGVDLKDATDDTAAMVKLLKAASKEKGIVEIEFPTTRIRIKDSLELPKRVIFTAKGRSWIMQTCKERPIFKGSNTERLWVENMIFSGLVNISYPKNGSEREAGIGFQIKAAKNAEIGFDDCGFYGISHAGIELKADKDNNAKIKIANSTFMTVKQVFENEAKHAEINNIWISSHGYMDEQAVIINRPGCDMLIANMITVPAIMKYHYPPHLPYVKDWPNSDNLRWIDNYGKLTLFENRFGGEWMGHCIVYNCDPRATLYMDGGITCFFSKWSKRSILYCEYPPAAAVIKNVGWTEVFPNSAVVMYPEFMKKPGVFITNVIYNY